MFHTLGIPGQEQGGFFDIISSFHLTEIVSRDKSKKDIEILSNIWST